MLICELGKFDQLGDTYRGFIIAGCLRQLSDYQLLKEDV
jgi:hypothetical protein